MSEIGIGDGINESLRSLDKTAEAVLKKTNEEAVFKQRVIEELRTINKKLDYIMSKL